MDLSLVFVLASVVDLLALRLIPTRKRALRFACILALFTVQTIIIVALIGSPFRPVFKVKDLPREFWLQLLACSWWALAARAMIGILALPAVLKKAPKENKILSDIVAACVYVCSGLAMMGFVFRLPLQGIVATSGVLAIVLGLALQNTLGDVFSGLSLSVEKPYDVGDAILLVLKSVRLGPGDFFREVSLLTGMAAGSTLTAITPGVLLGFCSEDLKPILVSRPELVESVSNAVARKQNLFTMLDHAAIQGMPIEPHDILSRIRNFFNLHV